MHIGYIQQFQEIQQYIFIINMISGLQDQKMSGLQIKKSCNNNITLKGMVHYSTIPLIFKISIYIYESFKSPGFIQPAFLSILQNIVLKTAGRIKQISIKPAQSKPVIAALVPSSISFNQPV